MTCGAPLLTRKTAPDCSLIVASVRLCTGSNGTYASCWYFLRTDWSLSPANIARSIGSSSAAREASDAIKISVSGSVPGRGCAWPRVSLFSVNVPVLSEQSTSTPASSSIASNRDTIALRFASSRAGGTNYRRHFALFNDRARVCVSARFLADRQRFSRESGLIDADVIARDECAISGNNLAKIQSNNVSRHQRSRINFLPCSVAQRTSFQC